MSRPLSRKYRSGKEYGMTTLRVPIMLYIDREVLDSIDDLAQRHDRSRADIMREAAQRMLVTYARKTR